MHRYKIKYEDEGKIKFEVFEGSDPGHAIKKAVNAGIKPISAIREGGALGGYGFTEWECPSLARVEPLPKEEAEQTVMAFEESTTRGVLEALSVILPAIPRDS